MNKLTDGLRQRAVSLILNHDCGSDKRGHEFLSIEDKRLVRRLEREWRVQDKLDSEIYQSCDDQFVERQCFMLTRKTKL